MPHIKPASREARAAYRQGLPPELRGTFDRLAGALANWRYELGWYHQVGTLLRQLRQGGTPEGGGSWLKGLPGALNVSPGLLVKASRFAQLYPRKKDVRELVAGTAKAELLSSITFTGRTPMGRLPKG